MWSVYIIEMPYYIIFIPKYRKKGIARRTEDRGIRNNQYVVRYKNVKIIVGTVCEEHIHLSVVIPPEICIWDFAGYLTGKSTSMIYDRHPELQSKWDKTFWASGYYVETIGNITDEAVEKNI